MKNDVYKINQNHHHQSVQFIIYKRIQFIFTKHHIMKKAFVLDAAANRF